MRRLRGMWPQFLLSLGMVASVTVPSGALVTPRGDLVPVAKNDSSHVTIWRANGDGTTSVRVYQVVPGSNAAKAFTPPAGWSLHDPAAAKQARASTASVCIYGDTPGVGDNLAIWPCVRWGWGGYSDPQVYFRDHTPAEWPVRQSVADWNTTVGVDSYWIWESSACPAASTGKHCVNVWAGWYGANDFLAWTDYSYDDRSNRFIDGTVVIRFNLSYPQGDANKHRSTVCEELGHALGVGHNTDDTEGSCMNQSVAGAPDDLYPGSNDKGLLTYVVYVD